jgi:DNA adenine methylase
VDAFVDRLRGVCIENRDAASLIPTHDGPETLFYADPPYVHSTRNMKRGNAAYECELNEGDHAALAEALHAVRGMVMISGYECKLYSTLYADWSRVGRRTYADGAKPANETLWLNPLCAKRLNRLEFDAPHDGPQTVPHETSLARALGGDSGAGAGASCAGDDPDRDRQQSGRNPV